MPSMATLCPYITSAALRRRPSSCVPSLVVAFSCRSSALRHSKPKKPIYVVHALTVFCVFRFAWGRLFRHSLETLFKIFEPPAVVSNILNSVFISSILNKAQKRHNTDLRKKKLKDMFCITKQFIFA